MDLLLFLSKFKTRVLSLDVPTGLAARCLYQVLVLHCTK